MEKLALLGGKPVRRKPFVYYPMYGKEEEKAVMQVMKSRRLSEFYKNFLGGEKVQEFEKKFAGFHKMRHGIAVNSGTSALHCAIAACAQEGKEVITTPYTFTATGSAVLMNNSIPVFADVIERTYNIDPKQVEKQVTYKTKAIIPVHLLGLPAEMSEIKEIAERHNLKIIEDCAQSPGAQYKGKLVGTIGDLACFSFVETKNMITGEGGMVLTNNEELAERCRLVRNHGEAYALGKPRSYLSKILGWNYRMTELHAAIGVEQLKKLSKMNAIRVKNAAYLNKNLAEFEENGLLAPFVPLHCESVFHIYGMLFEESKAGFSRDAFIKALNAEGIPVTGGYPHPIYLNPIFNERVKQRTYYRGLCPTAERLCKKALWFKEMGYPFTIEDMQDVFRAVEKIFSNASQLRQLKQ